MIQSIHKGVEIELLSHQLAHKLWKCDYVLVTHPERTRTTHVGIMEFPTKDLADEQALQEARAAIDLGTKGQRSEKTANPPRQVDI